MNSYLEVLQEKAKKIDAKIESCGFDKDCIKDIIASKIKSNLEHEEIEIIKEKAITIEAIIPVNSNDKISLLNAIEDRIKEILEEENERFTVLKCNKTLFL